MIARIDILAVLFAVGIAAALIYLIKLDLADNDFKLLQFITTENGRADKYSLAYVCVLLVSTWAMWYLTVHDRLTEWFVAAYIGSFVAGGILKTSIASKERIADKEEGK